MSAKAPHQTFTVYEKSSHSGFLSQTPLIAMVKDYRLRLAKKIESSSHSEARDLVSKLLDESRTAVASLLGAPVEDVVFIPNAATGIATVLGNLNWDEGDTILYFSTANVSCKGAIRSVCTSTSATCEDINVTFPLNDDDLVHQFRKTVEAVKLGGRNPMLAIIETVVTFPGLRFPWEALVRACLDLDIWSVVDGTHGIGHIDLTHLADVDPDYFVSECD